MKKMTLIFSLFCSVFVFAANIDFLTLQKTPLASALFENGTPVLGWFETPFENLNICEKKFSCLGREKHWQYFSFSNERFMVGIAAVNVEYLSNMFFYIFDRETKEYFSFEDQGIGEKRAKISKNSTSGETNYFSKNVQLSIINNGPVHTIKLNLKTKDKTEIVADLQAKEIGIPLVNSREVKKNHLVYTHQNSMMSAEGFISKNKELIKFDSLKDAAAMDYTAGLHRYRTTWNWASAKGQAEDGTPFAINFASDIGEGTNDVVVFWVGQQIYRVNKVRFTYSSIDDDWFLDSDDNNIHLKFHPEGKRVGNVNVGIIQSRFAQPFGTFSGSLRTPEGKTYLVKELLGVTEEHFSKW